MEFKSIAFQHNLVGMFFSGDRDGLAQGDVARVDLGGSVEHVSAGSMYCVNVGMGVVSLWLSQEHSKMDP